MARFRPHRRTWLIVIIGSLLLALAALAWGRRQMRGSLAQLDGVRSVSSLTAAVTITRDALGVPTITGTNRRDVARATGFVHAQDRFFQMDLLRRRGAGELAELFGRAALPPRSRGAPSWIPADGGAGTDPGEFSGSRITACLHGGC